jgi:pimeloyl-ACP methyl ester carboxylesterase
MRRPIPETSRPEKRKVTATFTQETREISGCKVALKRGGTGPKLLYLHGAGGGGMVQPFMEELARDYEVIAPEHPGFGASGEPGWLDNMHDLAYFYLDFMEALGLRDTTVLGASIGGWLALEMAVRDASRIRSMTLMGPSGIHVAGLRKGDLFMWTPEERTRNLFHDQAIAERMLAMTPTPEQLEGMMKSAYTVARLAWEPRLYDPHLYKWLHRIKVPVQIVWGEHDKILPAGYARELQKLIPGARVDVVQKCGHLPQTEKPQEFLRLFRDFAKSAVAA